MKILKIISLICIGFSFEIFSQSISIGFGSGLNIIKGGNYFTDNLGRIGAYQNNGTNTSFRGLSLDNEIQFQIGAKYSLNNFPMNLLLNIQYIRMRGNESMNIYDSFFEREFLYDVTTKLDIWSLQIGTSYIYNFYSLNPFITASLLINYFEDVYVELAQDRHISEYPDYKNGMRYGYSLGLGVFYNIFANTELELLSRYNDLNLLNSRDGEAKLNSISFLFSIYYKVL